MLLQRPCLQNAPAKVVENLFSGSVTTPTWNHAPPCTSTHACSFAAAEVFVVLTVYEVRDLLAQVPDGAEARRLAPYCFDTTDDKAPGIPIRNSVQPGLGSG